MFYILSQLDIALSLIWDIPREEYVEERYKIRKSEEYSNTREIDHVLNVRNSTFFLFQLVHRFIKRAGGAREHFVYALVLHALPGIYGIAIKPRGISHR